jgi:hypothetical protein
MLSLSLSLINHEVYTVRALIDGTKYRTALTHPFDAESRFDNSAYKRWLWSNMQQPHSATYKDLVRLARAHLADKKVIIRIHENAQHGDIILAAIQYIADRLQPVPKAHGSSPHHGFAVWSDKDEEEVIDERRFVWILGKDNDHARLGYVWDTEGVITALVPEFGLVKLGRMAKSFWYARSVSPQLTPRVHLARVGQHGLSAEIEEVFSRLIQRQQKAEQTEVARYHMGMQFGTVDRIDYEERYDPWFIHPEEEVEPPPPLVLSGVEGTPEEVIAAAETKAFLALHRPGAGFHHLLPTRYQGAHVKPVYKTKPNGSRWVLTPEMQARGALHLYQRI